MLSVSVVTILALARQLKDDDAVLLLALWRLRKKRACLVLCSNLLVERPFVPNHRLDLSIISAADCKLMFRF